MLDKEKALEIALAQIEKQFGKGAIMKLGDVPESRADDPSVTEPLPEMAVGCDGSVPEWEIETPHFAARYSSARRRSSSVGFSANRRTSA